MNLINQEEKHKKLKKEIFENEIKIKNNCQHEILIKKDLGYTTCLECQICKIELEVEDIIFECIILESDKQDNHLKNDIKNAIQKIYTENENILDTFESYINNENTRIYRRTK